MARTHKSDLPSGHHYGNGSSVLTPSFPLIDMGKFSRTSDFTVNPPNVKIDADVKKIVERESERLRLKSLKNLTDESDWDLYKIFKSADGPKDSAKAKLTRDGKSAEVSEVSKAINASSIDHSSKYLLSKESLYVYALSYVIYHEEVEDSEGMNDRILAVTENKIKTYFNGLLVKKFIQDRHLNLSDEQKKKILQAARTTNISYLPGEPAKAINKILSKYVDYGDLNTLVDKFFESGKIDPEKGTPQVRALMVKYLVDIGLTLSPSDFDAENSSSSGSVKAGASKKEDRSKDEARTGPSAGAAPEKESATEPGRGNYPETSLAKEAAAHLAKAVSAAEKTHTKDNPIPGESENSGKTPKSTK